MPRSLSHELLYGVRAIALEDKNVNSLVLGFTVQQQQTRRQTELFQLRVGDFKGLLPGSLATGPGVEMFFDLYEGYVRDPPSVSRQL